MLDALGREPIEERLEAGDGERDPARAGVRRVRLDEERGVLVDVQSTSSPTRKVGGRPKNRVYQSTEAARSETGTPATRTVIGLI